MEFAEIQKIAQGLGLKSGRVKKADLIRTIQNEEGYCACFDSDRELCDEMECCWRDDCISE